LLHVAGTTSKCRSRDISAESEEISLPDMGLSMPRDVLPHTTLQKLSTQLPRALDELKSNR
jgi:hypothetical protein